MILFGRANTDQRVIYKWYFSVFKQTHLYKLESDLTLYRRLQQQNSGRF